ncbi:MAG: hypothetical protein ACE5HT_17135 [Gemmatimonadales bacterium]
MGPTEDYLDCQAKTLVSAAQVYSVGSYTQFAEQYPIIYNVSTDDWDFFLTVGGVFIAASALNQMHLSDPVEERVMESVARELHDWDANGISAFEDCKQLFESTYDTLASLDEYRHDQRFLGADAVGLWIASNDIRCPLRASGFPLGCPFLPAKYGMRYCRMCCQRSKTRKNRQLVIQCIPWDSEDHGCATNAERVSVGLSVG